MGDARRGRRRLDQRHATRRRRSALSPLLAVVLVSSVLVGVGTVVEAPPAGAVNSVTQSITQTCGNSWQTITVPNGIVSATVTLQGAGGGGGGADAGSDYSGHGGGGGRVVTTLTGLTGGQTLSLTIGCGGGGGPSNWGNYSAGQSGSSAYGAGGAGGINASGGGGGGATALCVGNNTCTTPLVVASGGGGGGGIWRCCAGQDPTGGHGGNAGNSTSTGEGGGNGWGDWGNGANGGTGATQSAVGSGGSGSQNGSNGSGTVGGNAGGGTSSTGGGGGGGGYRGGGGGGGRDSSWAEAGGGGGAGSSYAQSGSPTYSRDTNKSTACGRIRENCTNAGSGNGRGGQNAPNNGSGGGHGHAGERGTASITWNVGGSQLAVTTQPPASTTAGVQFSFAVTVKDYQNNTVTGDSLGTPTVSLNPGTGCGPLAGGPTPSYNAGTGVITVTATINKACANASTFWISVYDNTSGLTLSATTGNFTTVAAAASKWAFVQGPSNVTAGVSMSPAVTVRAVDAFGNPSATTNGVTVTLALNSGSINSGATATYNAGSNLATFSAVKINTVGTYTMTASGSPLTASAASGSFVVSAAAASKLAFSTQPVGGVASGVALGTQPVVQVQDAFGNLVTSASNSVSLVVGTGSANGTLVGCAQNPKAAVSGVAGFGGCAIDGSNRSYTLVASASGLTSATSVSFAIVRGVNRKPVVSAVGGVAAAPGTKVRVIVPVGDADGYTANSTGDEGAPSLSASSFVSVSGVGGCVFAATTSPQSLASGVLKCDVTLDGSAVADSEWSFYATATDTNGGTSQVAQKVSGPVVRRPAPVGSVLCRTERNGGGSPVPDPVKTGVPSWCAVSFADPGVDLAQPPMVNGDVVADTKQSPSVGVGAAAVSSDLAGSDWFNADGLLGTDSGSCVLASTGVGVSGCYLPRPVVFRGEGDGTATLTQASGLAQNSTHLAANPAEVELNVDEWCDPQVYDGRTVAAPGDVVPNNAQRDFYAYNLGCGARDSDQWGYAYGIGAADPPFDSPYDGQTEAFLTDMIGAVGDDGFGEWHPEISTDPGTDVKLLFWGKTGAQTVPFYVSHLELQDRASDTEPPARPGVPYDVLQWLSGLFTVDIDGVRGNVRTPQTITFPTFTSYTGSTVTFGATSSSGLTIKYTATGAGCGTQGELPGNQLTLSTTIGASCKVTASQAGNGSYAPAANVSRTVRVKKLPQSITINKSNSGYYVGDQVVFTVSDVYTQSPNAGDLPVTLTRTVGNCTLNGGAGPVTVPGSVTVVFTDSLNCRIAVSQAGDGTYAAATTKRWSVTARKRPQTITANWPTGSYEHPAGPITAGDTVILDQNDLYTQSPNPGDLPVTLNVTVGNCFFGNGGAGPVQVPQSGEIALNFPDGLNCRIVASQAGDGTYAAASNKTWSVTATKKSGAAVVFDQPTTPRPQSSDIDITGVFTSPNGMTVTFSVTGPCQMADADTVEATGTGTCKIKATAVDPNNAWATVTTQRNVVFT